MHKTGLPGYNQKSRDTGNVAFQVQDEMHANRKVGKGLDQDSLLVPDNFNEIPMVISEFQCIHGQISGQPLAASLLTSESELLLTTRP